MSMSWFTSFTAYTMILSGVHLIIVNYILMNENASDDTRHFHMWHFLLYLPLYIKGFGIF